MDENQKIKAADSDYSLLKIRVLLSYEEMTRLLTMIIHNEEELATYGLSALNLSFQEPGVIHFHAELKKGRKASAQIEWQTVAGDPFGKFTVTQFKMGSSKTIERILMPLVKPAVNPIIKKKINEVLDDLGSRITGEIKAALLSNIGDVGVNLNDESLNIIWKNEALEADGLRALLIIISEKIPVWNPKSFDWGAVLAPIDN